MIQENRSLKLQIGELKDEKEQIETDVDQLRKERDKHEEELNRLQQRYEEMSFVHAEKEVEKDIKIEDLELKLNDIQSKQLQHVIEEMEEGRSRNDVYEFIFLDSDKTFADNSFNNAMIQIDSTHNSLFTQTHKAMTNDVETQTDQSEEIVIIQTKTPEISNKSVQIQTEKLSTNEVEMQTIPSPSEPVKMFNSTATQTKILQYTSISMQTPLCETMEAAVQSEKEPVRIFNNAAIQTEVKQSRSLCVGTEHLKTTETEVQTDQSIEIKQMPSTKNGEISPSKNVLELNVTVCLK